MSRNFLAQFIYLFTGVFSTCAAQVINYHGAGDQRAMLLPFCNYFGMMLVGLVPTKVNTRQRTFSGTSRNISRLGFTLYKLATIFLSDAVVFNHRLVANW